MVKKGLFRRAQTKASGERRTLRERGAAMVEFALVAPLFFLIVFTGIEVGLLFRNYLAVENLSRSAARIASIERDNPDADTLILDRIDSLTAPLQGNVTQVIIFKAESLDDEVPADCLTSGAQSNVCNVYDITGGDVAGTAGAPQTAWDATTRGPGEAVGIHIILNYQFATGFLDTTDLSTTTVEVIEQDF